jgi:DNA-binding HxlR family transcriptional regulator
MQPKRSYRAECPAARTVETVGEWWSILILRDAFQGFTRFDEFRRSLGIGPNILSRRLAHLTEAGLFERRLYSEKPPRYEYLLTEKGRDFFPVIVALLAWGNKHLAPEGKSVLLAARKTARPLDPVIVDAGSKVRITPANVMLVPGPRASAGMRRRLASIKALSAATASIKGKG